MVIVNKECWLYNHMLNSYAFIVIPEKTLVIEWRFGSTTSKEAQEKIRMFLPGHSEKMHLGLTVECQTKETNVVLRSARKIRQHR